jgi:basic membrane protein A
MTGMGRLAAVLTLAVMAVGCGSDEGGGGSGGGGAAETPAAEGAGDKTKLAMLLPGKQNDKAFSEHGAVSLKLAEEKGAETAVAEGVDPARQNDAYRTFATQETDVVIGWGGQYNDGAIAMAKQFPDTKFAVFFGFGEPTDNFIPVNEQEHEWSFILGYVASLASKTNHVGMIIGPCFPLTAQEAYGFKAGAEHANKSVKVDLVSLDSFEDPAAASEAARAMFSAGADGVAGQLNTGNRGIFAAAREHKGAVALEQAAVNLDDLTDPDVNLTSAGGMIWAAQNLVPKLLEEFEAGTLSKKTVDIPMPTSSEFEGLAKFPEGPAAILRERGKDPDEIYKKGLELQDAISGGEVEVGVPTDCPIR